MPIAEPVSTRSEIAEEAASAVPGEKTIIAPQEDEAHDTRADTHANGDTTNTNEGAEATPPPATGAVGEASLEANPSVQADVQSAAAPSVGAAIASFSEQDEGTVVVRDSQLVVTSQTMTGAENPAPKSSILTGQVGGVDVFGYDSDIAHIKEVWTRVCPDVATLDTLLER